MALRRLEEPQELQTCLFSPGWHSLSLLHKVPCDQVSTSWCTHAHMLQVIAAVTQPCRIIVYRTWGERAWDGGAREVDWNYFVNFPIPAIHPAIFMNSFARMQLLLNSAVYLTLSYSEIQKPAVLPPKEIKIGLHITTVSFATSVENIYCSDFLKRQMLYRFQDSNYKESQLPTPPNFKTSRPYLILLLCWQNMSSDKDVIVIQRCRNYCSSMLQLF